VILTLNIVNCMEILQKKADKSFWFQVNPCGSSSWCRMRSSSLVSGWVISRFLGYFEVPAGCMAAVGFNSWCRAVNTSSPLASGWNLQNSRKTWKLLNHSPAKSAQPASGTWPARIYLNQNDIICFLCNISDTITILSVISLEKSLGPVIN